jgi:signal transduction histidine kinase
MVLAGLRIMSLGPTGPLNEVMVTPAVNVDESVSLGAALAQVNESLKHRESLLAATAKASRLLLETPHALGAVPAVLRLLGEAAGADRVTLMQAQAGPNGEPWLVVANEWVAKGVVPYLEQPAKCTCDERGFSILSLQLRAGRSVCVDANELAAGGSGLGGVGTKTKAIVPIFVAGEFHGVVGFDNTRQRRAIGAAELSALETAAGVIGAAIHRERLVDAVRRERERAAEERVAALAKTNVALRGNLERLASEPDLDSFLGHVLLEATRQLDAAAGFVAVLDDARKEWRVHAHVEAGQIETKPNLVLAPFTELALKELLSRDGEPLNIDIERDPYIFTPSAIEYLRSRGHRSSFVLPLLFGGRTVGFIVLGFDHRDPVNLQRGEQLNALAQQATLAIELTRLGRSAQEAAVLVERNRIGQEIHDGLAQAFTGILMQLGAAEELDAPARSARLAQIFSRVSDLAREGLAEARRSVMALRPDQTRRGGLELALRQLAERSTVPGRVTCTFEGGGEATGLPPEHEHELLRIAQEAVSNAVRHGEPHLVRVSLTGESAYWMLAVSDDGRGMQQQPEHCARQGFGLTSMRERAQAIGGEWKITSGAGAGTRVSVRLPRRRVR